MACNYRHLYHTDEVGKLQINLRVYLGYKRGNKSPALKYYCWAARVSFSFFGRSFCIAQEEGDGKLRLDRFREKNGTGFDEDPIVS